MGRPGLCAGGGMPHNARTAAGSPAMHNTAAHRAITAASTALLGCALSGAAFLPPLVQATTQSVLRSALLGLALAVAMLLHWIFLGIAAQRMGRSVPAWVAFSVLLFPIGSVAALILLGWPHDEPRAVAAG
jgi:hypothetical protein